MPLLNYTTTVQAQIRPSFAVTAESQRKVSHEDSIASSNYCLDGSTS
jgi:hypothetical protein